MLAEKIYKIQKELEEKHKRRIAETTGRPGLPGSEKVKSGKFLNFNFKFICLHYLKLQLYGQI